MMKKYVKILCLLVPFFIVINEVQAAKTKTKNAKNKAAKVEFTDPTKAIVVKKSQPFFSVMVQANPTTGYSWSLKNYDANLITPIRHRFYPPKGKKLLGVPGYEKWTFKMKPKAFVVSHLTSITLVSLRPWDNQGSKVIDFRVVTK